MREILWVLFRAAFARELIVVGLGMSPMPAVWYAFRGDACFIRRGRRGRFPSGEAGRHASPQAAALRDVS